MTNSYSRSNPESVFVTSESINNFDVAADNDGNFVVVWETDDSIKFRVFDNNGDEKTDEITLNIPEDSFPTSPSVSMLPDNGVFTIAYDLIDPFGDDREIEVQSFTPDGNSIGNIVSVTNNDEEDVNPDVALNKDGQFLVAWEQFNDDEDSDIQVSYYGDDDQLIENYSLDSTSNAELNPQIAMRGGDIPGDGISAIVTFTRDKQDSSEQDVLFQIFENDDYNLNSDAVNIANSDDNGNQRDSSVGMDEDGNAIISFTDDSFGDDDIVFVKRSNDGNFFSEPVSPVNEQENNQDSSVVAMTNDGRFVIAYSDESTDSINFQEFDSNANRVDDTQQIDDLKNRTAIAVTPNSDYLMVLGENEDEELQALVYKSEDNGDNGNNDEVPVDFNRDGQTDILWNNQSTLANRVWLMDQTDLIESDSLPGFEFDEQVIGGAGDFNDDGNCDIVVRDQITGENKIWLMDGTDRDDIVNIPSEDDPNWEIKGVADFNDDNNPDIFFHNTDNGKNKVWLMDGTQRDDTDKIKGRSNTDWNVGALCDFDNNGDPDLLWHNQSTGKNEVWLMNGTDIDDRQRIKSESNLDWSIGTTGDFNDDGNCDIVWRNSSSGKNRVWFMNGNDGGDLEVLDQTRIQAAFNTDWTIVSG